MRIVSIHQPNYLPWLAYFHKIAIADTFVILDNVPFEKNSFINRNQIKTAQEWSWLTVPVLTKGKFGSLICDVEVNNKVNWRKKHRESIFQNYTRAAYFKSYAPFFEEVYAREWKLLSELNNRFILYVAKALGLNTMILVASQDLPKVDGRKGELILNICKSLGADVYFSGRMGRDYLNTSLFSEKGIQVHFQDYLHPDYTQLNQPFAPNLSIIDLLFNYGNGSLDKLMEGNMTKNILLSKYTSKGNG
jgi:hypothetical protein